MAPMDNSSQRPRSIPIEPPKIALPKGTTPMSAAPSLAKPVVGISRAFGRDENDHEDVSVRRYFTKLMISGGQGQRLRSERWENMAVEHFFLSLNTQIPLFNPERQPCSQPVATAAAVFAGFIWD